MCLKDQGEGETVQRFVQMYYYGWYESVYFFRVRKLRMAGESNDLRIPYCHSMPELREEKDFGLVDR